MKLKKILAAVGVVFLLGGILPIDSIMANSETLDLELNEVIAEEFNQQTNIKSKTQFNNTIIHNNGNPLKTDALTEKNDFELFGVYKTTISGVDYEQYYFINKNKVDKSELMDKMTSIAKDVEYGVSTLAAREFVPDYVNTYYWDFDYYGRIVSSFSNTVSGQRISSNSSINGVKGSIWDVQSVGQMVTKESSDRINLQRTRLDVSWTNQKLLDYGPDSSGSGTVSVTLDTSGPSAQWSMDLGSSRVNDLSSISSKYGRWEFKAPIIGSVKYLTTKSGIRASNTSGNFGVRVSHTFETNRGNHQTGVVEIFWRDR